MIWVLKLVFCPVGIRMIHKGIQRDNHPEIFGNYYKDFKSSEIIHHLWSPYLTWTLVIPFFEWINTWFFTRLIVFAINDALAQVNTFFFHTFLQIIFIMRRWIFTAHTNGIRTTVTTIGTVDITRTILKIRYLSSKLVRCSNHWNIQWELFHIPWGSCYRSKLRYNPNTHVRIDFHIFHRYLHLCKTINYEPKLIYTGEMTGENTHGQVLGRTKSRKFAQVETNSKTNILFFIIMLKRLILTLKLNW